jgi:UDP-N-acetylmuramate--alanine ligase
MMESIRSVYFIGVGGIGMSALARYFHSKGVQVSGYDKTETALTNSLIKEGIEIHFEDNISLAPSQPDLVVYTPAIPADHKELNHFRKAGVEVVKRSDLLGIISRNSFNICIAGTHGKTTISTMVAHLLRHSGYGSNAFLGGIAVNYGTNFWSHEKNVCVIEADEYDRSFLKLSPDIALISAMDPDHLDIYGDEETMHQAFIDFGNKLKDGGLMITKFGLSGTNGIKAERKKTYSLQNESASWHGSNIRMELGGYEFDAVIDGEVLSNIKLNAGGMHNVENMIAAIGIAKELGIGDDAIRLAVEEYRGVKRRFEYVIAPRKQVDGGYVQPVLIDDYAHHPEELRPLLKSVKSLFPGRVITIVFQPHLFSRTRDFADGFAEVLSMADHVILLPVYPAREQPMEGVTSKMIADRMDGKAARLLDKNGMLDWIKKHELNMEFGEVVVMAGAGDIDALVEPVKKMIEIK